MKDRISKILHEERMTATKFADEIGVQPSSISHIISGRNKPSTDFLVKLLERFRGINAEWLLTGKGSMYKESSKSDILNMSNNISKNGDLFNYEQKFENKTEEIESELNINTEIVEKEVTNLDENNQLQDRKLEKENEKNSNNKTIEKVVVFFTDKTFESYDPK